NLSGAVLLGPASAEHHRHQKGEFFPLQVLSNWDIEKGAIQQQTPDFQADFANTCQQALQRPDRGFVTSDPSQRQGVAVPVLNETGRGIGVKFRGALPGLAVIDFVATALRLPVVRDQMPIDRYRPRTFSQATRPRMG